MSRKIPKGFISLGTKGNCINEQYVQEIKTDKKGKTLILKSGGELRVNNYIKEENKYEAY